MSGEMERDIEKLKAEVADLRGTDRRIAAGLIRIEEKMDHGFELIIGHIDRKLGVMTGLLDNFTAEVEASRRERALHDKSFWNLKDQLNDHETRLAGIERRGKV